MGKKGIDLVANLMATRVQDQITLWRWLMHIIVKDSEAG
jgi:hypothetical protein